jgi:hypothetical protein
MSFLSWLIPVVHAAAAPAITPAGAPSIGQNPTETITNIATNIRSILLLVAGILATFYLIWSGIQYITSAGDPAKTKLARAGIVNAVIGIIVIVATTAIIRFAVGAGKCAAGATGTNGCVTAQTTSTTGGGLFGNWWDNFNNGLYGNGSGTTTGPTNNCPNGETQNADGSCTPNTTTQEDPCVTAPKGCDGDGNPLP